jgi:oligopeptidase A
MFMKNVFPDFTHINFNNVVADLDKILAANRAAIQARLEQGAPFTWDNFITPLEEDDQVLSQFWSPLSHLHSVKDSPPLRDVYNKCLPLLSAYSTEMGQNVELCAAYQSLHDSPAYGQLDAAQQKVIENALRDFKLSGVALTGEARLRYQDIQLRLSQLTTQFEEHVLDATQAFTYLATNEKEVSGLPASLLENAKLKAEAKSLQGWLLGIDQPSYIAVMQYADDRLLREKMYRAYQTRASELSDEGNFDNTPLINEILALRQEEAHLLGFANFTDYSLVTKMVERPAQILELFSHLVTPAKKIAEQEIAELKAFTLKEGVKDLASWDLAYYSEKLRQLKFNIDDEALRAYFPEPVVLKGLFEILKRLYGMTVMELASEAWHSDVKLFQIQDERGSLRGYVYVDLYARTGKRSGAWMDGYCDRFKRAEGIQHPIAYLTCNFTPAMKGQPALLRHDDVITLFHEMGHCLQHLLTQIDYPGVAGINGVPWDAVELPSQFFENWCWSAEALPLISQHYQTREALPEATLKQLLAAKNFQSGLQALRQVEFALFDLRIHTEYQKDNIHQVAEILAEVRDQVSVFKPPSFTRFPNSFTHIFAGGYASGYYSYRWAEVLSADAFDRFLQEGIFSQKAGRAFLQTILEQGGSRSAMDLFVEFRGRPPEVAALLKQEGLG